MSFLVHLCGKKGGLLFVTLASMRVSISELDGMVKVFLYNE